MSTFYGGEQLVNTVTLSPTASTGTQVIYTCPSGRYAEIYIKFVRIGTIDARIAGFTLFIDPGTAGAPDPTKMVYPSEFLVFNSGDELRYVEDIAPAVQPFSVFIKEYLIP